MNNMTIAQLKEIAEQKQIKIPAGAKKADIIKLLSANETPAKSGKQRAGEH